MFTHKSVNATVSENVAWKTTVSLAVATEFYSYKSVTSGKKERKEKEKKDENN
jgi:hypothetical protein